MLPSPPLLFSPLQLSRRCDIVRRRYGAKDRKKIRRNGNSARKRENVLSKVKKWKWKKILRSFLWLFTLPSRSSCRQRKHQSWGTCACDDSWWKLLNSFLYVDNEPLFFIIIIRIQYTYVQLYMYSYCNLVNSCVGLCEVRKSWYRRNKIYELIIRIVICIVAYRTCVLPSIFNHFSWQRQ